MRACNLKDVQYVSSRCCVYKFSVILAGSQKTCEAVSVQSLCLCVSVVNFFLGNI